MAKCKSWRDGLKLYQKAGNWYADVVECRRPTALPIVKDGLKLFFSCRLQVFRTNGRGWGCKTLLDIPSGSFVCEWVERNFLLHPFMPVWLSLFSKYLPLKPDLIMSGKKVFFSVQVRRRADHRRRGRQPWRRLVSVWSRQPGGYGMGVIKIWTPIFFVL